MKLEINIDATSLGASACILNLYRTIVGSVNENGEPVGGYRERAMNANLVYGIAVHKFIDIMYKTHGVYPKAVNAAKELFNLPKIDDKKKPHLSDLRHLETTCFNLWSQYVEQDSTFDVIELDGQPATEITFRIKYYEDDHIIVYLCGTLDSIGKFKNGCYAIRDWKTTSSWDNEGYFQQYELSRQLRIYLLALRLMASIHPDSTLGKLGQTKVGVFIDAIFLNKMPNDNTYSRSDVFQISHEELDAFQLTLDSKVHQLSDAVRTGYFPKEGILNGSCEQKFHKCKFWNVCKNSDQVAQTLLARDFKQVIYNPMNFNET